MSIKHSYNVPLSTISTFRMGGNAREVVDLETEADLIDFFASLNPETKWFFLGGGSNIVFPDLASDVSIVRFNARNISTVKDSEFEVEIAVDAGMIWDEFVEYTVHHNLSGLEALSAIPGTVGATPVQNVGAYGAEIKNSMKSLRAFDTKEKKFVEFSNEDCRFGYRDSIFKHEAKDRYIITQLHFVLSKDLPDVPQYLGVSEYLAEHGISRASLLDIRNAIISIRAKKLPDPKQIASVGSFFKNPIVSHAKGLELKEKFPTLAVFPIDKEYTKIGAGSLIDALGWKGKQVGNFSFYKGNAMVVVHEGGGTRKELSDLIETLNASLFDTYGLVLDTEPELITF